MESTYDVIKYTNDDVQEIRKQINMDTEEKREEAFKIIEDWLLKQDHLVQNKFSRGYIERCILFSKGSLEKAKSQIDRMCTMRTLMPHYFEITDVNDKELKISLDKFYVCCTPRLTKEKYRVIMIKIKQASDLKSSDILNLYKYFIIVLEFLKHYDYTMGYICICNSLDVNTGEMITKINLNDLQQVLNILIDGVGGRIKSIIFLTASKLMEGFVKTIKPLFKEKIRNRLHVATDKKYLKDYISSSDILPVEYGGTGKSLEQLNNDLIETLCSEPIQKLMREMHTACTDESKRQNYVFNEHYLGMPGSFRTMSLD